MKAVILSILASFRPALPWPMKLNVASTPPALELVD
jgi:hypothetical protein